MSNSKMLISIESDHMEITTIRNGVASTKPTSLADVQSVLTRDRSMETPLLPGHWGTQKYISRGNRELYAISTPPHVRTVKYDYRDRSNGIKEFKVPVPGMLWIMVVQVERRGSSESRNMVHMMAYALRNWIMSERDPLYKFPFSNVNSDYCCWGSQHSAIGGSKSITTIPEQFLNGIFNSDLDNHKFTPFRWTKEAVGQEITAQSTPNFFEYLHQEQAKAEAQGKNAEFRFDALVQSGRSVNEAIRHEMRHLN
jgi:hypothetical protein